MPPALDWEGGVWWLYERLRTQWRVAPWGFAGLDYGPAISLINARGWRIDLALELLQVVEGVFMADRADKTPSVH